MQQHLKLIEIQSGSSTVLVTFQSVLYPHFKISSGLTGGISSDMKTTLLLFTSIFSSLLVIHYFFILISFPLFIH